MGFKSKLRKLKHWSEKKAPHTAAVTKTVFGIGRHGLSFFAKKLNVSHPKSPSTSSLPELPTSETSIAKDSKAIVYIWTSLLEGGKNFGHAAIELQRPEKTTYISLVPAHNNNMLQKLTPKLNKIPKIGRKLSNQIEEVKDLMGMVKYRKSYYSASYEEDLKVMIGREANHKIALYSLDIVAMEKKFEALKEVVKYWGVNGNNRFFNYCNKVDEAASCSSFVRKILLAGDIQKLSGEGKSVQYSPSPHNILTRVRNAKQNEHIKYPKTLEYDIANKTVSTFTGKERDKLLRFC